MTQIKISKNMLLWGVETQEEIDAMCREIEDSPNYVKLEFREDNPFRKPKEEWATEMIQQYEAFIKKIEDGEA